MVTTARCHRGRAVPSQVSAWQSQEEWPSAWLLMHAQCQSLVSASASATCALRTLGGELGSALARRDAELGAQGLRQVFAEARIHDLLRGRQILIYDSSLQIKAVCKWSSAARAARSLWPGRACLLTRIAQIRIPGVALVAHHPDVGAGPTAQKDEIFVAAAVKVCVFDILVRQQQRAPRLDIRHGLALSRHRADFAI